MGSLLFLSSQKKVDILPHTPLIIMKVAAVLVALCLVVASVMAAGKSDYYGYRTAAVYNRGYYGRGVYDYGVRRGYYGRRAAAYDPYAYADYGRGYYGTARYGKLY